MEEQELNKKIQRLNKYLKILTLTLLVNIILFIVFINTNFITPTRTNQEIRTDIKNLKYEITKREKILQYVKNRKNT